MSPTVDALLPLSLLEAVRNVDTPVDDLDAELVPELRNKRLGLSDTVYAQIRRYTDAVKRNQRTAQDEAVALARLIGRRSDAEAVFRAAGRFLAGEAYQTISPIARRMMLTLPAMLARPIALRHARRIASRYFNGTVSRVGASVVLEVRESVTLDTAPKSVGCSYYEAGLHELLKLLVNGGGSVEHVRCAARSEGACSWRAEWRAAIATRA
jgi:predicted hydrocarbon binding protein